MNWEHFQAFLSLRWRLGLNKMKKAGTANFVFFMILMVGGCILGVGLFALFTWLGTLPSLNESPLTILWVWDGLAFGFLFFWLIGLITQLQRSELLTIDKFLHLPVTLGSVFVMNYLSSLVCLSLIIFFPTMLGFTLGLIIARGPAMLLVLPLLLAFVFAITALTYQFQGWLASLMANPRRRRTMIVIATMILVLLFQIPNLFFQMLGRGQDEAQQAMFREMADMDREFKAKDHGDDFQKARKELQEQHLEKIKAAGRRMTDTLQRVSAVANLALPPGWLPYGAGAAAQEDLLPPILATAGLGLLGVFSLRRAYRTTLRHYTGQFNAAKQAVTAAPSTPALRPVGPINLLVEKRLPGFSEHVSAIAVSSFRGLLRAPEAKMMLLSPVILAVVFGSMFLTKPMDPHEYLRPLIAAGAIGMTLLTLIQLMANQFGFDRSGFRAYVLAPVARRDILLGKNLALAPLAAGLSMVVVAMVQIFYPMRWDHLLAAVPQAVSMYLLYCFMANWLSILTPLQIASGSFRPVHMKASAVLLHLVVTLFIPVLLSPTLLPLGLEYWFGDRLPGVPLCLILSLVLTLILALLYRLTLTWQGSVLERRELDILQSVTAKAE